MSTYDGGEVQGEDIPLPQYRRKLVAGLPRWFNGYAYFAATNVLGVGSMAFAASRMHDVQSLDWLTIPLTFLAANFVEWAAHRGPMHNKRDFIEILFNHHTLIHHRYFPHTDMAYSGQKEWAYVLFPWWAILLVIGGLVPPSLLINHNHGVNVAALFYATGVGYYVFYEWLHLAYHWPEDSRIGRLALVRVLRRHHMHHHNTRLMQRYNFNVTFPIADKLFRTSYREPRA